MLNGLPAPVSISMRIGSGTLFFLILPALVILTDFTLSEPTSTSPKLSVLGRILSLPGTGVGVTVGVAVRVAVGVAVGAMPMNPSLALDEASCAVPANVAVSVAVPRIAEVTWQLASPLVSV